MRESLRRSLALLDSRSRRRLKRAAAVQITLSLMDLIGIGAVGVAGAVAISVLQTGQLPPGIESAAADIGLESLSASSFLVGLVILAVTFFTLKSAVAAWLLSSQLQFLARSSQATSVQLADKLLAQPLLTIQARGSAEVIHSLSDGVTSAVVFTLGPALIAVAEVSLLVVVGAVMLLVEPVSAVLSILFFFVLGAGLHRIGGKISHRAGGIYAEHRIAAHETLNEAIGAYRELLLSGQMSAMVARFGRARWGTDRAAATMGFVTQINRYVMETAVVFGIVLIAGVQLAVKDPVAAAGSIALFLAAALRLMPSLLRLQLALGQIKASSGIAAATYKLADDLEDAPVSAAGESVAGDLTPSIKFEDVDFKYGRDDTWTVKGLTFSVKPGARVGFVGASGAGKSTIIDLMLGVIPPENGTVRIGGETAREAASAHPGQISYVPQQVFLVKGSITENVALGLPCSEVNEESVWQALRQASLEQFVRALPDQLHTQVGENGVELSGGQRQRIGLARALYTQPRLLVLDEATSSLDAETEMAITDSIASLGRDVTLIVVAHRLATVRMLDDLMLIRDGRCIAQGTFDEIRRADPAFERQAALMGIAK